MASQSAIPRFLLPLQSPLWQGAANSQWGRALVRVRYASSSSSSSSSSSASKGGQQKPIVLEKPARFNPPSHGSRLRRGNPVPKYYGPQLTEVDKARLNAKEYPGLMAPEGTWSHWVWHSRLLHTAITMGTLLVLALATFFMNYAFNSPFKDYVPPISDLWNQPLYFFTAWWNVIVMHEADKGDRARAARFQQQDDAAKRRYFMKMHGIEPKDPVTVVFGRSRAAEEKSEVEARALEGLQPPPELEREPERKKWLGFI